MNEKDTKVVFKVSCKKKSVGGQAFTLYIKNSTDKTSAPGQKSKPCAHKRFYFSLLFPFPRSFIPFPFCFLLFFFTSSFLFLFLSFFPTLYHFLIRIMSHDVGFSTRQTLSSPLAHSLELPPIIQDTSMCSYR